MKKILLLIFLWQSVMLYSQDQDYNIITDFNDELTDFIKMTKPDSTKYSFNYFVYVANFYSKNCFTLGYILNTVNYSYVEPNYVHYFKDEVVVIRIDSVLGKKLGFKKINKTEKEKIIHKLFPSESGGFSYRGKGLTYCKSNNGRIDEKIYNNSDEIPFEKSIYRKFPTNPVIKKIEK